ncbi:MAG: beta-galactosidase, partial [Candidatus Goldbacteria bacterium]|nr:beta-galactosidase [Candidatus Goldiibacteriota bacterium]
KLEKIKVPSNWFLEGYDISGKVEYSKTIKINKKENKKYFITFKGVDYFADVYINNKLAGKHEGYFQKFRFDITNLIRTGINEVKVIVDSPKEDEEIWPNRKILIKGIFNHHDARPGSWNIKDGQDKNTGGIWNSVFIEEVDLIEIEYVKISPVLRDDGVWTINSELFINNFLNYFIESQIRMNITPYNFKGKNYVKEEKLFLKQGSNRFNLFIEIDNPELWWTWDFGNPNLYKFNYKLETNKYKDIYNEISGIREFKKGKDNFWYLNNKRIFLRGSNIIPTQWLSEYTEEKIKKDIKLIKDANLNIIRVHAHVNREEFYKELDKQGIMVWQDFALQWSYDTSEKFTENAISQIKDMVHLLYNRPSIVIWCCHNEPSINEKQLDPILEKKVKEVDSIRHVEKASDFGQHYYPGWYYDYSPQNLYFDMQNVRKTFIISEYGAQALPALSTLKKMFTEKELFPPNIEKWKYHDFQPEMTFNIAGIDTGNSIEEFIENSQNYQAKLIKDLTEFYRLCRYENINGILHFMFVECWPSITWAVIDYFRIPKKGYYALKEAMQPVYPGFRLIRKKISKTEKITWNNILEMVYIINDLQKEIKNVKLLLQVQDAAGKVYININKKIKNILPDSINYPFSGKIFDPNGKGSYIPNDVKPGIHKIKLFIYHDKKLISSNTYEFEVTEKIR